MPWEFLRRDEEYMDLTEEEPMFQGGFIWDYIDQSIYKKRPLRKRVPGVRR